MLNLQQKTENIVVIKLPSGETRLILVTCKATIGTVSNSEHMLERSGKAGKK